MQIIEIIIYFLGLISLIAILKKEVLNVKFIVSIFSLTIFFTLIHLIFGEYRWQILPLYISIIISTVLLIVYILNQQLINRFKISRKILLTLSTMFILISMMTSIILPVYNVIKPTGTYDIGTTSYVLTDESREELYADVGKRMIKTQFWYPAKSTEGYELAPWIQDGKEVTSALASGYGFPSFMLNHMVKIKSNAYEDAPISDDENSYPIIVLSHGWTGLRSLHVDIAEELASYGYIVVGIEHTYGSIATVISDSDIRYLNPDALPNTDTESEFMVYANQLVTTYANDIMFTIDELEKMNQGEIDSKFLGKLDLSKIGLIGHSTGAGADTLVALNDDRIKAIIGMDAWVEPILQDDLDKNLNIPALYLRSEQWETGNNNINLNHLVDHSANNAYLYQIDGTIHYDFSMVYMFSPISKYVGITGKVDKDEMISIIREVSVSFFDENLKNVSDLDLNQLDQYWIDVKKVK